MQRSHYAKKVTVKDASKLRVGIVVSEFNSDITEGLLEGALATCALWKVKRGNVTILRVPGSMEIPLGCLTLVKQKKYDALIALGCVTKGETKHDEYISFAVSHGLMRLMLDHNVHISFGVLTPNNLAQAKVRSKGRANKGREAAIAALEMALL